MKCYTTTIQNITAETILPIIYRIVIPDSLSYTDEHKTYQKLTELEFSHGTACHKYTFVDKESVINNKAVKRFNNYLKWHIKARKGVETKKR